VKKALLAFAAVSAMRITPAWANQGADPAQEGYEILNP
jgi:hypothetical protein